MSLELNVDESVEKKVIAAFFEAIFWNENNNKKKFRKLRQDLVFSTTVFLLTFRLRCLCILNFVWPQEVSDENLSHGRLNIQGGVDYQDNLTSSLSEFPFSSYNFDPFVPNVQFLYSLKTSEKLTVFWYFQGLEKGCIGTNEWVKRNEQSFQNHNIWMSKCHYHTKYS